MQCHPSSDYPHELSVEGCPSRKCVLFLNLSFILINQMPPLLMLLSLVVEPECDKSSATTYFWYRQTLNTTSTIAESGGLNVKMTLSLLVAWVIVCLAVIKGIASSGKVDERHG